MKIGHRLIITFFIVIGVHLLAYKLIFEEIIVEQIKLDRHEQFLTERKTVEMVLRSQSQRTEASLEPEWRHYSDQLSDDLMYTITVLDRDGNTVYSKESLAYQAEEADKKLVAEYLFQHESPQKETTVIQFYNNDSDIMATKGVTLIVLYIYASIILIGLFLIFLLIRWILRPVNELSKAIQETKAGKRSATFSYRKEDEFGQLFRYYTDMVKELRYSEERQQELIAAIAHDFRTPLTMIKGYASFIGSGRVNDWEKIRSQMTKIEQKVDDLQYLLDELQDFTKITEEIPLFMSRIHVYSFMQTIIEEYADKSREAGLTFNSKLRISKGLHIDADAAKLRRVLVNLLDNAIDYNKPNGSILLTCDQYEHSLLFSVIDKGEGIPEKDLPKIFTKFYRPDKSRNRDNGGTGLGLTICQNIVRSHGGEISVTSQLGEGSCFYFTIPFYR